MIPGRKIQRHLDNADTGMTGNELVETPDYNNATDMSKYVASIIHVNLQDIRGSEHAKELTGTRVPNLKLNFDEEEAEPNEEDHDQACSLDVDEPPTEYELEDYDEEEYQIPFLDVEPWHPAGRMIEIEWEHL